MERARTISLPIVDHPPAHMSRKLQKIEQIFLQVLDGHIPQRVFPIKRSISSLSSSELCNVVLMHCVDGHVPLFITCDCRRPRPRIFLGTKLMMQQIGSHFFFVIGPLRIRSTNIRSMLELLQTTSGVVESFPRIEVSFLEEEDGFFAPCDTCAFDAVLGKTVGKFEVIADDECEI